MNQVFKTLVKETAGALFLAEIAKRLNRPLDKNYEQEYLDSKLRMIKNEYNRLLPKYELSSIHGDINKISTDSFPAKAGGYYPEGSFYRVSIIYSGHLQDEKKTWFYRSMTVHYNENMQLMACQHHWGQSEHNWDHYKAQLEELFKEL